jgi:putative membrane-bound dehydrogenase-like protein
MKHLSALAALAIASQAALSAANYIPPRTGFDFPIYTNQPAGKQVSGQHAPASTPALSPQEAQAKFTLPEGFEIRLFAAEPMVVNPVFMTWDERGRLWVLELYEYPLGAPKGAKPRDRIKILEDTDADGKADKVHVWADGLNLATGLLLGNGGAYVGQAPHLLFLKDTDGDDRADKTEILLTGFGLEDRHELLNGFTWGPDGQLYMTHGVFTHSTVRDPAKPNDPGVYMNAAVARFHPRTKRFEVYADGTSNPWGVDFDRYGNAFVSACVIDHLFHLAPGGIYVRQGGQPGHPYSYGLLPSIVDHRHHMAAYCGVQVYEGDQFPAEHRGTILMGNIHDNAIHQDTLTPNGSTFKASHKQDLVRANDGWFMPTSTLVGPDGAVWISDWYDKYPCYQNARADPDGVDREHGRIWRVVYTGKEKGKPVPSRPEKGMNLAKLPVESLLNLLEHSNSWQRRNAQRLLLDWGYEHARVALGASRLNKEPVDEKVVRDVFAARRKLLSIMSSTEARSGQHSPEPAILALSISQMIGWTDWPLSPVAGKQYYPGGTPPVRAWLARMIGERGDTSESALKTLVQLASDKEPSVRLAVATALRQFTSGSLTVNTPPLKAVEPAQLEPIIDALIQSSADAKDPLIPFMLWMAVEPLVARDPQMAFAKMRGNGDQFMPLTGQLAYKTMRRVCDLQKVEHLDAAIALLTELPADGAFTAYAMNGFADGQKGSTLRPSVSTDAFFTKMLASPREDIVRYARSLGTLWGNAAAISASLEQVNNAALSLDERLKAIQAVRQLKTDPARAAILKVVSSTNPEPLQLEALRALAEMGGENLPSEVITRWTAFTPVLRRAAADMLASRDRWASMFLSALEQKQIQPGDVPATAIRTMTRSQADYGMLAKRAGLVFGRVRDADADKLKVIAAKKQMILNAKNAPDLKAGHALAQKTCLNCHKLHGEGAEVGPDLTGVGRSSLDALLANIIDPNQIIGAGYENVEIETKDGRNVSGRMVENTDSRVRLLAAGPKEEIVAKSQIEHLRVSQLSVMPEGLEQLPDADFRNLIAYILNPPGDKQPFSWKNESAPAPARGADNAPKGKKTSSNFAPIDRESVSLWNPEWTVDAPDFEGTPRKHVEFAGRRNVLETHPHSREQASGFEREVTLPATGKAAALRFSVAAHEKGDWELRVLANGKPLLKQTVSRSDSGEKVWQEFAVDLSAFAGQTVKLRLENAANGWAWEFGYWSDVRIEKQASSARR